MSKRARGDNSCWAGHRVPPRTTHGSAGRHGRAGRHGAPAQEECKPSLQFLYSLAPNSSLFGSQTLAALHPAELGALAGMSDSFTFPTLPKPKPLAQDARGSGAALPLPPSVSRRVSRSAWRGLRLPEHQHSF